MGEARAEANPLPMELLAIFKLVNVAKFDDCANAMAPADPILVLERLSWVSLVKVVEVERDLIPTSPQFILARPSVVKLVNVVDCANDLIPAGVILLLKDKSNDLRLERDGEETNTAIAGSGALQCGRSSWYELWWTFSCCCPDATALFLTLGHCKCLEIELLGEDKSFHVGEPRWGTHHLLIVLRFPHAQIWSGTSATTGVWRGW